MYLRLPPVVFAAILLLLTFASCSTADHHLDIDCDSLVPKRVLKPGEVVDEETFFFCHPAIPNGYLKCVVGRPEESKTMDKANEVLAEDVLIDSKTTDPKISEKTNTSVESPEAAVDRKVNPKFKVIDMNKTIEVASKDVLITAKADLVAEEPKLTMTVVLEEKEVLCSPGMFFNSRMKACVVHPLSDCAIGFAIHPPSHEQQLCEAYRQTLPANHTNVVKLICHDKLKHSFVVCPTNAASAVAMKCVNNTFFCQKLQKCVEREEDSECPIEWKEMARENEPQAAAMTLKCPKSGCICRELLANCRDQVVYAAHPDFKNKFIVCVRGAQHPQITGGECPNNLFWNDKDGMCSHIHHRRPVPGCERTPIQPAPPKPPVVIPVHPITPQPDGQHGCIDCDITEKQKCECDRHLRRSGKEVAYICDPESPARFLVCHAPTRVICQNCAGGMRWNMDHGACGPIQKCEFLCKTPGPTPPPTRPPTRPPTYPPTLPPTFPPTRPPTRPPTTLPPWTRPTTTTRPWTYPPTYPPTLPPWTRPQPQPICDFMYEFHPEKLNWYSAKRVCQANQGTLVTVPTLEVQQILRERFGSTSKKLRTWVGASDRRREGNWEWVTGERFGFTNWYRNEPSSKRNRDCLVFNYYKKGRWAAMDCDENKPFICQNLVCA